MNRLIAIGISLAMALGAVAGFAVAVTVIGMAVEVIAQHHEDRDHCLKQATNGYDIEQCH